jgi:hypothetical protein
VLRPGLRRKGAHVVRGSEGLRGGRHATADGLHDERDEVLRDGQVLIREGERVHSRSRGTPWRLGMFVSRLSCEKSAWDAHKAQGSADCTPDQGAR